MSYVTVEEYENINLKVNEFYKERFQNSGDFTLQLLGTLNLTK